jgi:tetratricopeptide (TPR) repeat protein
VAEPAMAEATARLGVALQLDRLGQGDAAIAHLRAVIAARPPAPYGALARAHLQLGDVHAKHGRRDEAVSAYHTAIAIAPPDDPMKIRARAHAQLRYVR